MAPSARSRSLRWVAPFATAAVIALIVAVPGLSAASAPSLAALTPAQLLAKVQQANVKQLSGTINLSTDLGIPNLSALSDAASGGHSHGAFNPTDLLSGSHQALVWFAGPDQSRVALLQSMAETDVVHNGQNIWTWDSSSKKVVHYTLAADTKSGSSDAATSPTEPVKTPQQVADDLLAHLSPSTSVTVGAPTVVAKQKAYQLLLAPSSAASTVDHVAIAVDSNTGMPLQVEIFAKGQKAAALKLGFGQIDYSAPAASEFAFTPPPGSTVTSKTLGGSSSTAKPAEAPTSGAAPADQSVTVGQDWTSVQILKNVTIPAQLNDFLKAATTVNTAGGPGRLLESSLVNVIVLNDGRVAVGAVNASTLEAAIPALP
jgi:outer membrane lipoprotein-sorting protein